MNVDKTVSVDVLVIGGSGAAMMSAVSALREGASVAVVSKGKVGKSGNAIMIGGGFAIDGKSAYNVCGEESAPQQFTDEQLYRTIVKCSFFMSDQKLARQYTKAGPHAVKECLRWAENAKAKFLFFPPASLWNTCGHHFGMALQQSVKEYPEIQVYEDTIATDLLKAADGKVCGAIAVNVYSGEIIAFQAKAVVVATGGIQLYSLKNSISDMTGDSVGMALRAGARVKDMEYFLFIPTLLEPHGLRGSIIPYLMTLPIYFPLKPVVTDLDGRVLAIDEKYHKIPATNKMNKIMYAYFWGRGVYEKYAKYGNAFYFDFSGYTDQEIIAGFDYFIDKAATWYKRGLYNGIDLNELCAYVLANGKRLKVGLGNEYSCGGIVVDEQFSTGIDGLYAAGEVTSGVFGAFRSADGITEMLAHGLDAGRYAALYAKSLGDIPAVNTEALCDKLLAPFHREKKESAPQLIREIEQLCDNGFNFFRDQAGLDRCETRLAELAGRIKEVGVSTQSRAYNLEWLDAITVENLYLCAVAGVHAASMRKESRGTHMRIDYPEVNNREYLYNIVAQYSEGTFTYRCEAPVTVDLTLPAENVASIPEYILNSLEEK